VSDDLGLGVRLLKVFEQEPEGCLLLGRTGVSIASVVVHSSNVANTDGVRIVGLHVSASEFLGTTGMNGAILIDHPVVATAGPAFGLVDVIEVFNCEFLVDLGVGAVNDNPLDVLHGVHLFYLFHLDDT